MQCVADCGKGDRYIQAAVFVYPNARRAVLAGIAVALDLTEVRDFAERCTEVKICADFVVARIAVLADPVRKDFKGDQVIIAFNKFRICGFCFKDIVPCVVRPAALIRILTVERILSGNDRTVRAFGKEVIFTVELAAFGIGGQNQFALVRIGCERTAVVGDLDFGYGAVHALEAACFNGDRAGADGILVCPDLRSADFDAGNRSAHQIDLNRHVFAFDPRHERLALGRLDRFPDDGKRGGTRFGTYSSFRIRYSRYGNRQFPFLIDGDIFAQEEFPGNRDRISVDSVIFRTQFLSAERNFADQSRVEGKLEGDFVRTSDAVICRAEVDIFRYVCDFCFQEQEAADGHGSRIRRCFAQGDAVPVCGKVGADDPPSVLLLRGRTFVRFCQNPRIVQGDDLRFTVENGKISRIRFEFEVEPIHGILQFRGGNESLGSTRQGQPVLARRKFGICRREQFHGQADIRCVCAFIVCAEHRRSCIPRAAVRHHGKGIGNAARFDRYAVQSRRKRIDIRGFDGKQVIFRIIGILRLTESRFAALYRRNGIALRVKEEGDVCARSLLAAHIAAACRYLLADKQNERIALRTAVRFQLVFAFGVIVERSRFDCQNAVGSGIFILRKNVVGNAYAADFAALITDGKIFCVVPVIKFKGGKERKRLARLGAGVFSGIFPRVFPRVIPAAAGNHSDDGSQKQHRTNKQPYQLFHHYPSCV